MDSYSKNKQLFNSINLDLYSIEKIREGLILLKVNINRITLEEIDLFISTISILCNEVNNNLIIDLSQTQSLDEYSCKLLIDKIIDVSRGGGSIRLLVTEENPQLPFSTGMAISRLNVYLNLKSALIDFNIKKRKSHYN